MKRYHKVWYVLSGFYFGGAVLEMIDTWPALVTSDGRAWLYALVAYLCFDKAERGPK